MAAPTPADGWFPAEPFPATSGRDWPSTAEAAVRPDSFAPLAGGDGAGPADHPGAPDLAYLREQPGPVASSGPAVVSAVRPRPSRAWVTLLLIAVNVAVWVAVLLTGGGVSWLTDLLALTPHGRCLSVADPNQWYPGLCQAQCAAEAGRWVPGVRDGAWWQVLTSAFTHVEVTHIGFNMLALWSLGPALERVMGWARYLAVYVGSALVGSLFVVLLSGPQTSTVGASGAIFGLMAALFLVALWNRGDVRTIAFWIAANVAVTVAGIGTISWQGHLSGFLGGLVLTALLVPHRPKVARGR